MNGKKKPKYLYMFSNRKSCRDIMNRMPKMFNSNYRYLFIETKEAPVGANFKDEKDTIITYFESEVEDWMFDRDFVIFFVILYEVKEVCIWGYLPMNQFMKSNNGIYRLGDLKRSKISAEKINYENSPSLFRNYENDEFDIYKWVDMICDRVEYLCHTRNYIKFKHGIKPSGYHVPKDDDFAAFIGCVFFSLVNSNFKKMFIEFESKLLKFRLKRFFNVYNANKSQYLISQGIENFHYIERYDRIIFSSNKKNDDMKLNKIRSELKKNNNKTVSCINITNEELRYALGIIKDKDSGEYIDTLKIDGLFLVPFESYLLMLKKRTKIIKNGYLWLTLKDIIDWICSKREIETKETIEKYESMFNGSKRRRITIPDQFSYLRPKIDLCFKRNYKYDQGHWGSDICENRGILENIGDNLHDLPPCIYAMYIKTIDDHLNNHERMVYAKFLFATGWAREEVEHHWYEIHRKSTDTDFEIKKYTHMSEEKFMKSEKGRNISDSQYKLFEKNGSRGDTCSFLMLGDIHLCPFKSKSPESLGILLNKQTKNNITEDIEDIVTDLKKIKSSDKIYTDCCSKYLSKVSDQKKKIFKPNQYFNTIKMKKNTK